MGVVEQCISRETLVDVPIKFEQVQQLNVHVWQQRVAYSYSGLGRFGNGLPDVGFLAVRAEYVVIAIKWEEGGELHPAVA